MTAMFSKFRPVLGACLALVLGTVAQGSLTGDPSLDPVQFSAASTNLANYNLSLSNSVPGRDRPHVLFNSSTSNTITLDFFNDAPGLAFFEFRVDGAAPTGGTAHPVVAGDFIHSLTSSVPPGSFSTYGGVSLAAGTVGPVTHTFTNVGSQVEVRLALGGESDYRFNWTAFEVDGTGVVPEPSAVLVWAGVAGCVGVAYLRKKRIKA